MGKPEAELSSDLGNFPEEITPEEFIKILERQVRNGLRSAEEAAEIIERVRRSIAQT